MKEYLSCIDGEMSQFSSTFEHMLRTQVPLADNVIRYFLDRRGKQLRPILTLLAAKTVRGEVNEKTIYGAVAVELLHNATLMHDDVIDKSDERRGAATINKIWDNHIAVLTGDFFLAKSLIAGNATGSLDVNTILGSIVSRLVEGELEQVSNARSHMLNEQAYFSVIGGKTASLFSACLQIGAKTVDASPKEVEMMAEIGEKIGLVFQIRDDIFDYYPSNAQVGKPTGHDVMEGKVTLPLLYALHHAPADMAQQMSALLEKGNNELSESDVKTLVDFARAMGGIEYAQARMKNIAFEAKQLLSSFPESPARDAMTHIIDYFIERDH